MNVYDKRVRSAQNLINFSSILRLCGIAALALFWASSYASPSNLMKIHNGSSHIIFMISGFALDVFLTVNWLPRPKLYTTHVYLHLFLGVIFYYSYIEDAANLDSDGFISIVIIFAAIFIWALSWVPFFICKVSNNDLAKAEAEQRYWKEKAEKEQAQLTGDKNE